MFGLFKKNKDVSLSFKFTDPPNTACFTCRHVIQDGMPILSVTHDHDGTWQFLCGQPHTGADANIISLKQATEIDPSVNELYELPIGVGADRAAKDAEWILYKLTFE